MRIYIAKMDIEKAKEVKIKLGCRFLASEACPITQTLNRKFPKGKCTMGYSIARIGNKTYKVCNIGRKLIDDFDMDKEVKPTKIILKEYDDGTKNRG